MKYHSCSRTSPVTHECPKQSVTHRPVTHRPVTQRPVMPTRTPSRTASNYPINRLINRLISQSIDRSINQPTRQNLLPRSFSLPPSPPGHPPPLRRRLPLTRTVVSPHSPSLRHSRNQARFPIPGLIPTVKRPAQFLQQVRERAGTLAIQCTAGVERSPKLSRETSPAT